MSKELDSILSEILRSLEDNIEYVEHLNDHSKFPSYSSFIFSRIFDKYISLVFNYRRVKALLTKIKVSNKNDRLNNSNLEARLKIESDIEMISAVLRPLYEMYLELLSIKFSLTKVKDDHLEEALELFCQTLYSDSISKNKMMQLKVCKDFYACEPLFLKHNVRDFSSIINQLRQNLSEKNLPLLFNVRNKLLSIINNNDSKGRYLLGMDYLTSYVLLSRKNHFSYSNVLTPQFTNKTFLNWCLILFVSIYLEISDLLHFQPIRKDELFMFKEILSEKISPSEQNNIQIGNYVLFDFGIAEVTSKEGLTVNVKFVASNQFKKGEEDIIPKVFIQKEITQEFFIDTHSKYYAEPLDIYNDENYEKLYYDLAKEDK